MLHCNKLKVTVIKTDGYYIAAPTRPVWAKTVIALVVAALLCAGWKFLILPPIYKLARIQNPLFHYEGYILIIMAVMLTWFYRLAVDKLAWCAQEIHRLVSALLMVSVIGIDVIMHAFSIPHMEGWWLPMFGGSAAASVITGWLQRFRQRHSG